MCLFGPVCVIACACVEHSIVTIFALLMPYAQTKDKDGSLKTDKLLSKLTGFSWGLAID